MRLSGPITKITGNQSGTTLIETLVAFGVLSAVVFGFLSGLATSLGGTLTAREQAVAEGLVRGELEYIKSAEYSAFYLVSDNLSLPEGWFVPSPQVELVQAGLQRVNVTAEHNGVPVLSISTYKMDRYR